MYTKYSHLKVGDTVITIERYRVKADTLIEMKYLSIITKIEPNHIEVVFTRPDHLEYSKYLRWGSEQTTRNYFDPEGNINIELL